MAVDFAQILKQLVDQQTQAFQNLLQNAQPNPNVPNHSTIYSTINSQLGEFSFNPEMDSTFQNWLDRYGPFIQVDGKDLPDQMQVRLLLGKLGSEEYNRYAERVLPSKPTDFTLAQTIDKLKAMFDFASQVNAICERSQMDLTKDEIKALIFLTGLSDTDRELRERCLRLLKEAKKKTPPEAISFEKFTEECRAFLSLRNTSNALAHSTHGSTTAKAECVAKLVQDDDHHQQQSTSIPISAQTATTTVAMPFLQSNALGQRLSKGTDLLKLQSSWPPSIKMPFAIVIIQVQFTSQPCHNVHLQHRRRHFGLDHDRLSTQWQQSITDGRLDHVWPSFSKHYGNITYQGVTLQLECHVAPKGAMNLFGLPWIKAFEAALQRPIATTLSNFSHPSNNTKNSNDNMPKQFSRQNEVRRRTFAVGDNVLVLNYRYNKSMWLQGKVVEGAGSHHQQHHQIVHHEPETEPITPQRRVRFADEQPEEQPVQDGHNQNEVRRSNRNRRPPKLLDMDTSKTRYGYKN
ncbi:hypothetical protein niasHT_013832 [Heterodera trifolii]|uniref:DUF7083 domain-containing protein n=1 Tax=Heterodera trifolii TaxID=157864 RepID=A0ABD2KTN3_9BILA